eukprot:4823647-Alexandrium_andersonii.AAC.1
MAQRCSHVRPPAWQIANNETRTGPRRPRPCHPKATRPTIFNQRSRVRRVRNRKQHGKHRLLVRVGQAGWWPWPTATAKS